MGAAPVYFDAIALEHATGPHHPETPRRVSACVEALRASGRSVQAPESPVRAVEAIERVHHPMYVRRFRDACSRGPAGSREAFSLFDAPDNPISSATFKAAFRSVGLALAAADAVLSGREPSVFVASRPPGHHALADEAMGFCYFNTAAVVARDLVATHQLDRVLVADFDVHHGNGTQEIFWEDEQVAYVSVHRFPFYPGTGAADEVGVGRGRGTTANAPLPAGTASDVYAMALEATLDRLLRRFRPDFVVVSAGFDAHVEDPLGGMRVDDEGFRQMAALLGDVARTHAGGRLVSLLEGGYAPDAVGRAAGIYLQALQHPD